MARLPTYKAVLWDMDGTLVLSEPLIKKSLQAYHDKLGFPISDDLYARATGISYRHAYEIIKDEFNLTLGYEDWQQQAVAAYVAMATTIERRAETADIVQSLYNRGIKQAVISNSPHDVVQANVKGFLREFIEPANIFTTIISADDLRNPKPDPEGYRLAAQRLGVAPQDCLVIEDSPTGVRAGKAAGCFTIYWPEAEPKQFDITPDLIVGNIDVLKHA